MKKFFKSKSFIYFSLSLLIAVAVSCAAIAGERSIACAEGVGSEIVLPSSYSEYYDLYCPVDIAFCGETFAILENDEADASKNRLVVFNGERYTAYSLSDYGATEIEYFGNDILFLSGSRIYKFLFADNAAQDTGLVAAYSFSVCDNDVLLNNSNGIEIYSYASGTFSLSCSLPFDRRIETLVLDSSAAYYFSGTSIYSFDRTTEEATQIATYKNLGTARYSAIRDGKLYFAVESGIFCCDAATGVYKRVNLAASSDDVRGLAFGGERLYACYKGVGAVNEIDLKTFGTEDHDADAENFTSYAITYDGNRIDRISSAASSLSVTKDALFVLDGFSIKRSGERFTEYSLAPFVESDSVISAFSTDDKTLCAVEALASGDTVLHFYSFKDGFSQTATVTDYTSVTDVICFEGDYLFINNRTNSSKQYAEVLRIAPDGTDAMIVADPLGTGWKIGTDAFGEIYLDLSVDGGEYIYSATKGKMLAISATVNSIFGDFDGNVYFADDEKIYRFDGTEKREFTPTLWANAPENAVIKKLGVLTETDRVYVLYNGFVVAIPDGLGIVTPKTVPVPEDFLIDFTENVALKKAKSGSKLFRISLDDKEENGVFDYIRKGTETEETEYLVIRSFDNYSLAANLDGTFFIRNADLYDAPAPKITEADYSRFVTSDMNAYKLPLAYPPFDDFKINKNAEVTVYGRLVFGGTEYSLITFDGKKGYVPSAFLKSAIADSTPAVKYESATIGRRGATVYEDSELKAEKGTLKYGDTVYVVSEENGIKKIVYGDGYGYIKSETIKSRTYYSVRSIIVISALFIGLVSSLAFVLKTRVFRKKKSKTDI